MLRSGRLLCAIFILCTISFAAGQNFRFAAVIDDGEGNSKTLILGMDPAASDGIDGFDIIAPPPPPAPGFDARIRVSNPPPTTDYHTDVRASTMAASTYEIRFSGSNMADFTMNWDNSLIQNPGTMVIEDIGGGGTFSLDMMTTNNLNLSDVPILAIGIFNIVINATTDDPLPVELLSFTALGDVDKVHLAWSTASEVNNLGFELYRSQLITDDFQKIASYENNDFLLGAGNSSQRNDYAFTDHTVVNGQQYFYKLADVSLDGQRYFHSIVTATAGNQELIAGRSNGLPTEVILHPNYPNPFNPETTLRFELPDPETGSNLVELVIYNALGEEVVTLFTGGLSGGEFTANWDGRNSAGLNAPSGTYLAQLKGASFSESIKMLLIR